MVLELVAKIIAESVRKIKPTKPGEIITVEGIPFRFLGEKYGKAEGRRVKSWRCRVCTRTTDDLVAHAMHELREREDWAERMKFLREVYGINDNTAK